jgi:hypothetical protein
MGRGSADNAAFRLQRYDFLPTPANLSADNFHKNIFHDGPLRIRTPSSDLLNCTVWGFGAFLLGDLVDFA